MPFHPASPLRGARPPPEGPGRAAGPAADDAMDRALLQRVERQDTHAFATLYHRYAPRLAGYLTPRLRQPALVEEVCHDVLLVVWQRAADVPPTIRVSSWIFGIAKHKAYKACARAARQAATLLPRAPEADETADPERHLTQQEHLHLISRVLERLPPEQRAVITWACLQGWSVQEIAAHTGEPVPTIKSRLQRARHRLAQTLAS